MPQFDLSERLALGHLALVDVFGCSVIISSPEEVRSQQAASREGSFVDLSRSLISSQIPLVADVAQLIVLPRSGAVVPAAWPALQLPAEPASAQPLAALDALPLLWPAVSSALVPVEFGPARSLVVEPLSLERVKLLCSHALIQ